MAASPTEELRAEPIVADPGAPVRRSASRTSGATRGAATSATRAPWSAGAVFILMLLYCLIVPIISPYDPDAVNFADANLNPSLEHPFGTDKFGRDLFTRTALGGRVSILIAFGATFAILAIGVVYGSISGFVGGRLDNGLMRFLDALYGLPYLPFAIITLAIIGYTNIWAMMIALSIASWFTTARIVRGQVLTLKENDYVRAAKAVGARWYRILDAAPAAEHARDPDHRDLPRAARRDPRRGVPLLHRPRDQPAGRLVGLDGARGPRRLPDAPDRDRRSRRSRSRRSSCARTSSPTACATPSTRERGRRSRGAARGQRPAHALLHARGHRPCRRRDQLRGREGQDARDRRRVRLRQVGDGALDHGPDSEASRGDRLRRGALRGPRPDQALRAPARGRPRPRDRDDLPGPDDVAQPDADDRDADHRDDQAALRRAAEPGEQEGDRADGGGADPACLGAARATTRTGSPAACASA